MRTRPSPSQLNHPAESSASQTHDTEMLVCAPAAVLLLGTAQFIGTGSPRPTLSGAVSVLRAPRANSTRERRVRRHHPRRRPPGSPARGAAAGPESGTARPTGGASPRHRAAAARHTGGQLGTQAATLSLPLSLPPSLPFSLPPSLPPSLPRFSLSLSLSCAPCGALAADPCAWHMIGVCVCASWRLCSSSFQISIHSARLLVRAQAPGCVCASWRLCAWRRPPTLARAERAQPGPGPGPAGGPARPGPGSLRPRPDYPLRKAGPSGRLPDAEHGLTTQRMRTFRASEGAGRSRLRRGACLRAGLPCWTLSATESRSQLRRGARWMMLGTMAAPSSAPCAEPPGGGAQSLSKGPAPNKVHS